MIFRVPENRNILTENRPKFRFGNRTEPKPKFTNRTEPKTENLQTDPPLKQTQIWRAKKDGALYSQKTSFANPTWIPWQYSLFGTLLFLSVFSRNPERKRKNASVLDFWSGGSGSGVTPSDREEYGLLSSSKIGVVKITCHEFTFIACDGEFLHHYYLQQQQLAAWLLLSKAFNWRKKRKFAHVSSDSCQVQITVTAMSPLQSPLCCFSQLSRMMALSSSPTCILLLTPRR